MNGGKATDQTSIGIERLTEADIPAVLSLLSHTFGRPFTPAWFKWKHRSSPWGKSPGWIATDEVGLVGVRLFLPWRFEGNERERKAMRPCDTVTVSRARGKGVFRRLTEHAVERLGEETEFLFNTPNEQSRPGYHKMGFVEWEEVGQRAGVVWPKGAQLTEDAIPLSHQAGLGTARSSDFIDWRYRRCPVYDYQIMALAQADGPNGIVARVGTRRGVRMLVVEECWGGHSQEVALVRAASKALGARIVWVSDSLKHTARISTPRRPTVVTRFDLRAWDPLPPSLSLGDIESVL